MLGCGLLEVMHRDAAWQLGRHLLQQAPAASRRTGQHGGAARAILGASRGLKPTARSSNFQGCTTGNFTTHFILTD